MKSPTVADKRSFAPEVKLKEAQYAQRRSTDAVKSFGERATDVAGSW